MTSKWLSCAKRSKEKLLGKCPSRFLFENGTPFCQNFTMLVYMFFGALVYLNNDIIPLPALSFLVFVIIDRIVHWMSSCVCESQWIWKLGHEITILETLEKCLDLFWKSRICQMLGKKSTKFRRSKEFTLKQKQFIADLSQNMRINESTSSKKIPIFGHFWVIFPSRGMHGAMNMSLSYVPVNVYIENCILTAVMKVKQPICLS